MPTIAPTKTTQAVFAVTDYTMTKVRLTEPTDNWHAAQQQWSTYDDPRIHTGRVTVVNGEPIRFFVVREMSDPDWKDAPKAEGVMTIDFDKHHFMTKGRSPLKAVREYAAAQGIHGTEGGWLRREDGSTVVQGWWNYISMNLTKLRRDEKAVAAALAHHFGVKRPQPRKARTAPTTRTIDGIKWISKGEEQWTSEDGRYGIEHDHDFETECDEPHPVRISKQMRDEFWATDKWEREHSPVWPRNVRMAIEANKKGYHCEGGQPHFYSQWVAGTNDTADVVIAREDTFTDAARKVARYSRGEIASEG